MFLTASLMTWAAIAVVSSTSELGTNQIKYIGTVEGKSYFYDHLATNWTNAQRECQSAGMHLATFTTSAQVNFIDAHQNVTGNTCHWTGARDSQTTSQFVWDYNNSSLSSSVLTGYGVTTGFQTCVYYYPRNTTDHIFRSAPCSANCYRLCEIIL